MILFDTSAWVEYFIGSERGAAAGGYMESGEEIITPDVVLAEIARKYLREGIGASEVRKRLYYIASRSEIETIDAELGLSAGQAWQELATNARKRKLQSPSLIDGIVLATARRHRAKVLTADPHFGGLEEAQMI